MKILVQAIGSIPPAAVVAGVAAAVWLLVGDSSAGRGNGGRGGCGCC